MKQRFSFFVVVLITFLIGSQTGFAKQSLKKFDIQIRQSEFGGKPFKYQFWLQRETDSVASMELVVVISEAAAVHGKGFRQQIGDLGEVKSAVRIKLQRYPIVDPQDPRRTGGFASRHLDNWRGSVRADEFPVDPDNPAFIYQLVVTQTDGKVVTYRTDSETINTQYVDDIELENGDQLITFPAREVMADKDDWLGLTKGIKIPQPTDSNQKFSDLNNAQTKTPKLKTTGPVANWVNSADKEHVFVLEQNGLLRKVSWRSMTIEKQIQLPAGGSPMGTSLKYVIVSNPETEKVWCLDRKSLEVKHVIPIAHCDHIAASVKSNRFLVYNQKQASIVNLSSQLVTHRFDPRGKQFWFRNDNQLTNGFEFKHGNFVSKVKRGYIPDNRKVLAVSPSGSFFALSNQRSVDFYESADSRFAVRRFQPAPDEQMPRSRRPQRTPAYTNIRSAAICDIDESFFLAVAGGVVHHHDISSQEIGKYQLGFDASKMIVSPTGDCLLAANASNAVRLPLPAIKKYAIHEESKLTVVNPSGEAVNSLSETKNSSLGSVSLFNFAFKPFVQNAVFHPDGKLLYMINSDHQLLEIGVDDFQIKRTVDLQLPISDLTVSRKGILILCQTIRKAVVLGWDDLQIVSSFRTDVRRLRGHKESEFIIGWSGDRVRVYDLAGEQVQALQMDRILHERRMENRMLRWPSDLTEYYFSGSGNEVIGRNREEVKFELTPQGELNLKSLVPENKTPRTFTRTYTGLGVSIKKVSGETQIFDANDKLLLAFDETGDFAPFAISSDRSMLVGVSRDRCRLLKLTDPDAVIAPVANAADIGPVPAEVWKSLSGGKTTWIKREKYDLISTASHIFVGKSDRYHDVLAFDLATQKFLPPLKAKNIVASPDGKFVLHDYQLKRKTTVARLDGNLTSVSPEEELDISLTGMVPIPFSKNEATVFLKYGKSGVYDPSSNELSQFPEYSTMDYDLSRQQILARKTEQEQPLEFFWLDPATGEVQEELKVDYLKPGETIVRCRVSHDGKKLAVAKKGPKGTAPYAILDLENKKVLWEPEARPRYQTSLSRRWRSLEWSQNDKALLINDRTLVDVNKATVSEAAQSEYLEPIPSTDLYARFSKNKRTVDIIDPLERKVLRTIGIRRMVRVNIRNASEVGSLPVRKEYTECSASSFTLDGKFMILLAKPYNKPRQLFFFDLSTGLHVKSFPLPSFSK